MRVSKLIYVSVGSVCVDIVATDIIIIINNNNTNATNATNTTNTTNTHTNISNNNIK